jgi:hypothetical protein
MKARFNRLAARAAALHTALERLLERPALASLSADIVAGARICEH